jgi:hypothetical protein
MSPSFFGAMISGSGAGAWHPWLLNPGGGMSVPPWENPRTVSAELADLLYGSDHDTANHSGGRKDTVIVPFSDQVLSPSRRCTRM